MIVTLITESCNNTISNYNNNTNFNDYSNNKQALIIVTNTRRLFGKNS